jgi:hypothetical protein
MSEIKEGREFRKTSELESWPWFVIPIQFHAGNCGKESYCLHNYLYKNEVKNISHTGRPDML